MFHGLSVLQHHLGSLSRWGKVCGEAIGGDVPRTAAGCWWDWLSSALLPFPWAELSVGTWGGGGVPYWHQGSKPSAMALPSAMCGSSTETWLGQGLAQVGTCY